MLNEGEIRKMMKFANIKNLTENFLETKLEEEDATDEDTLDEGEDEEEETLEEETHEEELELDADPMGEEPPMDDELPMGDEPAAAAPAGNEEIAKQLAAGVAALLSQVLDVDVESTDDGMADEPALEEPELPEPALEAPPEEEPVMEMGYPEEEEELPREGDMYQEDLVNEITRRVAKRLLDINKK